MTAITVVAIVQMRKSGSRMASQTSGSCFMSRIIGFWWCREMTGHCLVAGIASLRIQRYMTGQAMPVKRATPTASMISGRGVVVTAVAIIYLMAGGAFGSIDTG